MGTNAPDNTLALLVRSFGKLYTPAILIVIAIDEFCMKENNVCVGHEPIGNSYLSFERLKQIIFIIIITVT
jgi:hypothetical protein